MYWSVEREREREMITRKRGEEETFCIFPEVQSDRMISHNQEERIEREEMKLRNLSQNISNQTGLPTAITRINYHIILYLHLCWIREDERERAVRSYL